MKKYCKLIYNAKNKLNENVNKFISNLIYFDNKCYYNFTQDNTLILYTGDALSYCPYIETTNIIKKYKKDNMWYIETKNSFYTLEDID